MQRFNAEKGINPCLQLGEIDRLGDVVVGAGVQPFDLVLGGVERRLHYDGNERQLFGRDLGLEPSDDFHAVHLRHHHVEENQVWTNLIYLFQCLLAIVGSIHFVAARLQTGTQELDVVLVIVYDKDARFLLATLHCFCRGIVGLQRRPPSARRAWRGIHRIQLPSPSRDPRRARAQSAR